MERRDKSVRYTRRQLLRGEAAIYRRRHGGRGQTASYPARRVASLGLLRA
jgi:hypothetical protein